MIIIQLLLTGFRLHYREGKNQEDSYRNHLKFGGIDLKKLFCSLTGFVLVFTLFFSVTGISYADQNNLTSEFDSNKMVDVITAKKAAASLVLDEISLGSADVWTTDTLTADVEYVYDPSGNHVAYQVSLIGEAGQPQGYVIVSAFLDEEPIQMWTTEGSSIVEELDQKEIQSLASKANLSTSTIIDQNLVWYGGTKLALKVINSETPDFVIDDTYHISTDLPKDEYPIPVESNHPNREKWETIKNITIMSPGQSNPSNGVTNIDPSTWETGYNSIDKFYVSGVTNQKQWTYASGQYTGCSPTAASNIVMWFAKSYPSLNPTNNQRDIVMSLRKEMGTTQTSSGEGLTDFYNIDDGLQSYFRKNGRPNAEVQNGLLPDYDIWKMRIKYKGGQPTLQSYWSQDYFGNHTVTVVGYKEFVRGTFQSNSKYLVVKNNWSNDIASDFYVKYGTWNTNIVTWVVTP
ncbi:hypothetical protein ACQKFM_01880 [Paenibacillus xylanexedens]|uniref:hypothetical protein n=1 Tax=Paenibacillus xylanexedens TaxID=528191 RepID=UPI003CFF6CA1